MQGGPSGRSRPPSQAHRRAPWRGLGPAAAGVALAVALAVLWLVAARSPGGGSAPSPSAPRASAGAAERPTASTPSAAIVSPPAGTRLPALASRPLPGAPGVLAWSQPDPTHLRVVRWNPATGKLTTVATLDTWPDPAPATPVERTIVAAPDGRAFAFREAIGGDAPRQRLRIFDSGGRQVWSLPADEQYPWALVWSADGSRLAMATGHLLVLQVAAGDPVSVGVAATVEPAGSGSQTVPLGFSTDGGQLLVYPSTSFYPDYWTALSRLDLASGGVTRVGSVPGASASPAGRLAPSNGTTELDAVDPAGGRVVIVTEAGAAIRSAGATIPLALTAEPGGTVVGAGWGAGGTLVVATRIGARPDAGFDLRAVDPGAAARTVGPAFSLPEGDFTADLLGVRNGFALVGVSAAPVDATRAGDDELVMVRLGDAATGACVAPGPSLNGAGLHFAGWLR